MALIEDYFYRYPVKPPQIAGRCRVRIYSLDKGKHVVLLTESKGNSGEPIAAVGAEIATDLTKRWNLTPSKTRWIEHVPAKGKAADKYGELKFSWSKDKIASKGKWARLTIEEAEELTDETLREEFDTGVGWDMGSLNAQKRKRDGKA